MGTVRVIQVEAELALVLRSDGSTSPLLLDKHVDRYRKEFLDFERRYFVSRDNVDADELDSWNTWRRETAAELSEVINGDPRLPARSIVIQGGREVQVLPWEALRNASDGFESTVFVRRPDKVASGEQQRLVEVDQINLLLVVARPFGRFDIPPSNLLRELKKIQRRSKGVLNVDVLRGGGTYQNLVDRLRSRTAANRYNIVHFDVHGKVGTPEQVKQSLLVSDPMAPRKYADEDFLVEEPDDEVQPFVFLERPLDRRDQLCHAHPISIKRLARAIRNPQKNITPPELVVMNACQSASPTNSLAFGLVSQGIRAAIGLRQPIGFEDARTFARGFYSTIIKQDPSGEGLDEAETPEVEPDKDEGLKGPTRSVLSSFRDAYAGGAVGDDPPSSTLASLVLDGGRDLKFEIRNPEKRKLENLLPGDRDYDENHINRLLFTPPGHEVVVVGPKGSGKSDLLERIELSWVITGLVDRACRIVVEDLLLRDGSTDESRVAELRELVAEKFLGDEEVDDRTIDEIVHDANDRELLLLVDGVDRLDPASTLAKEIRTLIAALSGDQSWIILGARAGAADEFRVSDHIDYPLMWDEARLLREVESAESDGQRIVASYADGIPGAVNHFTEMLKEQNENNCNEGIEEWILSSEEFEKTRRVLDETEYDALRILGFLEGPPFPSLSAAALRELFGGALGIDEESDKKRMSEDFRHRMEKRGLLCATRYKKLRLWYPHPYLAITARRMLRVCDEAERRRLSLVFAGAGLVSSVESSAMGNRKFIEYRRR